MRRIGWEVVQAEMGVKPTVIIHDLIRLALTWSQAEMHAQALEIQEEFDRLPVWTVQAKTDGAEGGWHHPP